MKHLLLFLSLFITLEAHASWVTNGFTPSVGLKSKDINVNFTPVQTPFLATNGQIVYSVQVGVKATNGILAPTWLVGGLYTCTFGPVPDTIPILCPIDTNTYSLWQLWQFAVTNVPAITNFHGIIVQVTNQDGTIKVTNSTGPIVYIGGVTGTGGSGSPYLNSQFFTNVNGDVALQPGLAATNVAISGSLVANPNLGVFTNLSVAASEASWWGMVGDGVTDNSAAFQSALATMGAAGGIRKLDFTDGRYYFASTGFQCSNVVLQGTANAVLFNNSPTDWFLSFTNGLAGQHNGGIYGLTLSNGNLSCLSGGLVLCTNVAYQMVDFSHVNFVGGWNGLARYNCVYSYADHCRFFNQLSNSLFNANTISADYGDNVYVACDFLNNYATPWLPQLTTYPSAAIQIQSGGGEYFEGGKINGDWTNAIQVFAKGGNTGDMAIRFDSIEMLGGQAPILTHSIDGSIWVNLSVQVGDFEYSSLTNSTVELNDNVGENSFIGPYNTSQLFGGGNPLIFTNGNTANVTWHGLRPSNGTAESFTSLLVQGFAWVYTNLSVGLNPSAQTNCLTVGGTIAVTGNQNLTAFNIPPGRNFSDWTSTPTSSDNWDFYIPELRVLDPYAGDAVTMVESNGYFALDTITFPDLGCVFTLAGSASIRNQLFVQNGAVITNGIGVYGASFLDSQHIHTDGLGNANFLSTSGAQATNGVVSMGGTGMTNGNNCVFTNGSATNYESASGETNVFLGKTNFIRDLSGNLVNTNGTTTLGSVVSTVGLTSLGTNSITNSLPGVLNAVGSLANSAGVLNNDGSGTLSWVPAAGGSGTIFLPSMFSTNAYSPPTVVVTNLGGSAGTNLVSGGSLSNLYIGQAGNTTGTGGTNVGIGVNVLQALTSGGTNVAVGFNALAADTTGYENTAIGDLALSVATIQTADTAVGYNALSRATTGNGNNTAVGGSAGASITTGANNTAIGEFAVENGTATGSENSALGVNVLKSLSSGSFNTGSGYYSMGIGTVTGNSNTANGSYSLYNVSSGSNNTATGTAAGASLTTGSYNTLLGWNTMSNGAANLTGFSNLVAGAKSGTQYSGGESNNILLANIGVSEDQGWIRIGTDNVHTNWHMAGNGSTLFVVATNGISTLNTNVLLASSASSWSGQFATIANGITNTYGTNMVFNYTGTSGTINLYSAGGVAGVNAAANLYFTGTVVAGFDQISLPPNWGVQITSGIGVTAAAHF